jgi:hypothetical protein
MKEKTFDKFVRKSEGLQVQEVGFEWKGNWCTEKQPAEKSMEIEIASRFVFTNSPGFTGYLTDELPGQFVKRSGILSQC